MIRWVVAMPLFNAWLLMAAANALDVETVRAATAFLANGEDPYVLENVEPRSADAEHELPDLVGCRPVLSPDSSREYIQIDFRCQSDTMPYAHRVYFSPGEGEQVNIFIDPIPFGVGPTEAAFALSKLPLRRQQFNRFVDAVLEAGDPTLDGLVPLTESQISELNRLADCDWGKRTQAQGNRNLWISFVQCPWHERDRGKMIETYFDDDRRVTSVQIAVGRIERGLGP